MDVVLFNPAPRSGWQPQRRVELPLGLLCSATPLVREGVRVRIVDEYANPGWRQELEAALAERPVCFGVTCMTGPQIRHALEGCRLARQRHPGVPIVWGGVHASLLPEQTLQNPYADVVVVGEGEDTFPELVRALARGGPLGEISGIAYREDGRTVTTSPRPYVDLDAQPPLSYHLIDMAKYRRRLFGLDHVSFNSSRGCVFRCSFCWDPVMHGRRWRAMGPETVLGHLERIVRDHDLRGFLFTDDHFFIDLDRAHRILEGIVASGLGISISKLQIRADALNRLDADFLDLMVRAGVKRVSVGVESGSQRVLDLLQKDLRVEDVAAANRKLAAYPIVPVYLFMMGLPTETREELGESIALAVRLTDENTRAVKTFNIYTPYPGTELYGRCVELGLEGPECLEDWAEFNFRNVSERSRWVSRDMRRLVEALDFPLMFLGKGHFVAPYKRTHPLVVALARLYYPLARYRVTRLDARFPLETKLVKALGLFGRQD
ncbi:MAG: radical SAM protein [Thermodesulfobacteriota bacterium]